MNIYLLCPDTQQPIGGIKIIYQQVDILNKLGYRAFVLHTKKGFRCNWFTNRTSIAYFNEVKIETIDLVWLPENALVGRFKELNNTERAFRKLTGKYKYKHSIIDIWNINCRKWVFNQNAFYTFDGVNQPISEGLIKELYKGIETIVCVGENNRKYLKKVFPELKIERIYLGLNEERIFSFQTPEKKQGVIAYMPRKNADHINRLLPLLFQIPAIKQGNWVLKPLDGLPYQQIAKELHNAAIFLSFGYPEGFSMPPAEAMISGCVVVGYHGEGGEEYFPNDNKFNVPFGAVSQYAETVAEAIEFWEAGLAVEAYTKAQSEHISATYNEAANHKNLELIAHLF
jgi:glycosyltransferase involved in cell wall biosynthesis